MVATIPRLMSSVGLIFRTRLGKLGPLGVGLFKVTG
jgi:hypothetical protein